MIWRGKKRAISGLLGVVLVLLSVVFANSAFAEDDVEIWYFYEQGCSDCVKLEEFLENVVELDYPITVKRYDVHIPQNANLMLDMADAYGSQEILKEGTPAVFIADFAFQGAGDETIKAIEKIIQHLKDSGQLRTIDFTQTKSAAGKTKRNLTWSAVILAAAIDSVNPCAFGVLALLLGTMLVISKTKKRRHVVAAGLSFTAATFICYLLMGFGLFAAIQVAGVQRYIYMAVSVLAILIGLWNTKDFFWYSKGVNIEVPKSWRPMLKKITASVTSAPGAFVIGCAVSVFLLPCTSGPYVVIIGMLGDSATRMQAGLLLAIYNFIFVLPFIIITLAVGFGMTSPARVENWRQKWLEKLHLLTGIFMLILGVTMVVLLAMGII